MAGTAVPASRAACGEAARHRPGGVDETLSSSADCGVVWTTVRVVSGGGVAAAHGAASSDEETMDKQRDYQREPNHRAATTATATIIKELIVQIAFLFRFRAGGLEAGGWEMG